MSRHARAAGERGARSLRPCLSVTECILAIWLVVTGTRGVGPHRLGAIERAVRVVSGLAMLTPSAIVQVSAVVVGASLVLAHFLRHRRVVAA